MKLSHFGLFDIESYDDRIYSTLAQKRIQALTDWEYEPIAPVGRKNPDSTQQVSSLKALARHPSAINACLLGGGNIIQCARSSAELYMQEFYGALAYADLWLGATTLASEKAPVLWNAPCVPEAFPLPLESLIRQTLNKCSYISVCDETSRKYLLRTDPDIEVAVVPDTCWEVSNLFPKTSLLETYTRNLTRHNIEPHSKTVVFHIDNISPSSESLEKIASALDTIATSLNAFPIIIPLTRANGNYNTSYNVASLMTSRSIVIDDIYATTDIIAYLAHCSAYIGSSKQAFITASAYGVPAICIGEANNNNLESIKR